ncbi:MAG TPA: translesion DNA synthesis-associated protein ImuA [Ideonella sp.]|jgi:protein ImuA|nr:translesion DNA synthesis-associated protein ImuA [Ideonella sp.]
MALLVTPALPGLFAIPPASPPAALPPAARVFAGLGRAELLAEPSALHPALWRAQRGGAAGATVLPSGFAALDAELPGGGWPVRALTELLLAQAGVGEIRLLAPLLAGLARVGRSVLLLAPPAEVNAVALAELGWPPGQCIVVRASGSASEQGRRPGRKPVAAELCWAVEQALRSGQAGAVLVWPGAAARPEALRRWQLAAQGHEGPAFLLRDQTAANQPSPAPLRLRLQPAGPDELALHIVKRRGPAMPQPLTLGLPPVLSERARWRSLALQAEAAPASPGAEPGSAGATASTSGPLPVRPHGPVGHAPVARSLSRSLSV